MYQKKIICEQTPFVYVDCFIIFHQIVTDDFMFV